MRTRKELKSRPKSVINGMVIASAQVIDKKTSVVIFEVNEGEE